MKFSPILSLLALTFTLAGSAGAADIIAPSAESRLLAQTLALQGEKLSQTELQQKATAAIQTYDRTAPHEGREDRMALALSSMGIMSPKRVVDMQASIHSSLSGTSSSLDDTLNETVRSALSHANRGAEFSDGCVANLEWGAGFAVIALGLFYFSHDIKMMNNANFPDRDLFIQDMSEYAGIAAGSALIVISVVELLTSGCLA